MGLGHAVFFVPDLDEAHRFEVDGLGFGRSYSLHFTPVPGVDVKSAFYHRNSRHPNDQMFSFYLETPTGFQVEVGYGDVVVGEDWVNDTVYGQITAWGASSTNPSHADQSFGAGSPVRRRRTGNRSTPNWRRIRPQMPPCNHNATAMATRPIPIRYSVCCSSNWLRNT